MKPPRLKSINIKGYRPFKDFSAQLGPLEVIVGANGSGKSSLFEFLRFLREILYRDSIPSEIIPDSIGQQIFHNPGPDRISWDIVIDLGQEYPVRYKGELRGPVGDPHMIHESVQTVPPEGEKPFIFMEIKECQGFMRGHDADKQMIELVGPNQLGLRMATDPAMEILYKLRNYLRGWRFYNAFIIDHETIRSPVIVKQEPFLQENAMNLSSLLLGLMADRSAFEELQQVLRSTIPGFKELTVKAKGDPGQVVASWREDGIETDLTLADLSDGILQLICWAVLCIQPNPPSLIFIDEPELGLHPRTLPFLAGLLEKASERTQVLVATHSSYFLAQFDISQIAVMRKERGAANFAKPANSKALVEILKDFGPEEIENLHLSDELEILA
jgi:predicted ATPase